MTTILYSHPVCERHDPGSEHPESPARLIALREAFATPAFAALERREAPLAEVEQIARVHDDLYVRLILDAIPATGHRSLDNDTHISPASGAAALRAAGANCAAVDAVIAGEADNAFCTVRPPGHHAEPNRAMGFCLFNNIAVGAAHARVAHEMDRVAVVDFDVHHGNGTQTMFWNDPGMFFASTHQAPFYPGTGSADERGAHNNIVNVPMFEGDGSAEFREAMEHKILPALRDFAPEFLFISAGFDGHANDPLAQIQLREDDYMWITEELVAVARKFCAGRIVSTLEGGYNLPALAASAGVHLMTLMQA